MTVSALNSGPDWTVETRPWTISRANPTNRVMRDRLFRTRGGKRPNPFLLVDFLGLAADFATAGAGQELELQNVGWILWKCVGIQPFPKELNFVLPSGYGHAAFPDRTPSARSWVHFHDVLRSRPGYATTVWRRRSASRSIPFVGTLIEQFAQVSPPNVLSMPFHDRGECPLQTAFDFFCRPQTTDNSALNVQFN